MSLTNRQKEIALALGIDVDKADAFLSRIREEQKVYGYHGIIPLFTTPPAAPITNEELLDSYQSLQEDFDNLSKSNSELVEALKDAKKRMDRTRDILTKGNPTHDRNWGMLDTKKQNEAIANHAKRMKGEE